MLPCELALQWSLGTLTSQTISSFPEANILIFPTESAAAPSKDHISHKMSPLLFEKSGVGRGWVKINLYTVVSI